jgi:outer membrane protein assembly factor BamD
MFKKHLLFLLVLVVGFSSCSDYQKVLKSKDSEFKYEKAIGLYEEGDYYRALQLFDQLIPVFRGTQKAEMLNYYYAQSYYKQEDYIMASYYFKKFAKEYPRSKFAEECYFLSAYCKFLDSPVYSKDQTNTYEAVRELQGFVDAFPTSERVEECNELIGQLRTKLEKKSFEIASLYLKMSDYQAAVTTFNNLLKEYPDTKFREDAMFGLIEANYRYASKSILSKQEERYQSAIESYDRYIANFPESDRRKQADVMYEKAKEALSLN